MRLCRSASALCASGALAIGCAVYDSELVRDSGQLSSSGNGGSSDGVGGSKPIGGTSSAGGTNASGDSGSNAIGGTGAGSSDGGEPNGEAGEAAGGTNSAGSGGVGGNAGTSAGGNGGNAAGGTNAAGSGGTGGASGASGSGGNGGSGGSVAVAVCSDHPIPAKSKWMATASVYSMGTGMEDDGLYNPPAHMIDSNYTERWSSGTPQAGGEWIQIDFGATVNLTDLVLNVRGNAGDYPRGFEARMSSKTQDFNAKVLAMGSGEPSAADPDNTNITFSTMGTGRYLTVRQTTVSDGAWWTVTEVLVSCTNP